MPLMTLSQEDFQSFVQVNPWTESEIKAMREGQAKQELIRQDCVSQYSSSPLYQAMAAKDPDYWKNFPTGRVNLRNNNAT